jgi:hypothetical protein
MLRKDLVDTIRTVHSGRRRIPPAVAAELAEHVVDDQLSEREVVRVQWVEATLACSLLAGVWNAKVLI